MGVFSILFAQPQRADSLLMDLGWVHSAFGEPAFSDSDKNICEKYSDKKKTKTYSWQWQSKKK